MRLTMAQQFFLSCVSSDNLFNICTSFKSPSLILMLAESCITVCNQVVFGFPCGCITFLRYSSKGFFAGVSGSKHMGCPSHVSLLYLIILLHGSNFVMAWNLVIFLCQLIPMIFLRRLCWRMSMVFSSFFVRVICFRTNHYLAIIRSFKYTRNHQTINNLIKSNTIQLAFIVDQIG